MLFGRLIVIELMQPTARATAKTDVGSSLRPSISGSRDA
jgi:hypothetical protein